MAAWNDAKKAGIISQLNRYAGSLDKKKKTPDRLSPVEVIRRVANYLKKISSMI